MTLKEKTLFTGSRFQVVRLQQVTARGDHSRDIVRHPGSVTIIPLLPENRVCLIRNFRVAVGKPLLELPAGTREPGEDPQVTAVRELEEETGYRANHIERLMGFYVSPGFVDERMELFLATDLTPGPPAREIGEEIENVILDWTAIETEIDAGRIEDAKTLAGLWLARRWLDRNPHPSS